MVFSSSALPADRSNPNHFQPLVVCKLHHIRLLTDQVKVAYGFPSQKHRQYQQENFPNSNSYVDGGCVADESRRWARVSYCSECRKVEAIHNREAKQKEESARIPREMQAIQENRLREDRKVFGLPQDR